MYFYLNMTLIPSLFFFSPSPSFSLSLSLALAHTLLIFLLCSLSLALSLSTPSNTHTNTHTHTHTLFREEKLYGWSLVVMSSWQMHIHENGDQMKNIHEGGGDRAKGVLACVLIKLCHL